VTEIDVLPAGVGVALVTIFDAAGALDPPATADLALSLVGAGMRSVLVAGTTGEAAALSLDERACLVTAVRSVLPPEVVVIAGAGAASAPQAVELTAAVIDAGADVVLSLSPPNSADPRPYYEQVAVAAGDVKVLAYHFPFMSGPGVPVEILSELPVAGLKDSSGDISRLYQQVATFPGAIYVGAASLALIAGALGCAGALLAIANVHPELSVRAFAGDSDAQLEIFAAGNDLAKSRLRGIKEAVAVRFGTSAAVRMG
jgi:4-hydroxy-tetrahydrodipicolinate synthase